MSDYVSPRPAHLETPPGGDDEEIREVELDHVDERFEGCPPQECQTCQEPVDRTEPHAYAFGWYYTNTDRRRTFCAVFCDRECWTAWASRESE